MSQVVIVHAADDALPARALAEKLRKNQLNVIAEKALGAETREALGAAQVAIVLWSPRSAEQPALAEDAEFARGQCKVIHAIMQNAQAPQQFLRERGVNLTGWRGEDDFPTWLQLAKFVAEAVGVAQSPPQAASNFLRPDAQRAAAAQSAASAQSGASTPLRRGAAEPGEAPQPAAKSGANFMMIAAIAVVVLGLGGGAVWWMNQNPAQPGATTNDSAWEEIDPTNAEDLKAALNDPELRAQAQRALAELEEPAFAAAMESQDLNALEQFLADFPESRFKQEIRQLIDDLKQDGAEQTAPEGEAGATTGQPAAEANPPATEPGGPADLTAPPGTGEPPPGEAPGN